MGVELAELQQGIRLVAGHKVVLVIGGAPGSRKNGSNGLNKAKLENPRWGSNEDHADGDTAEMLVDVVEGSGVEAVTFVVERLHEGKWSKLTEVPAKVDRGQARGSLKVEHPATGDPGANQISAHYRFSVRVG
jgi:hypothetical protein